MVEILFMNRSNGPDTEHWKLGDIVAVQENGHEWSINESKTKWVADGRIGAEWNGAHFILKLPNVTMAQVEYFLAEFPNGTPTQGNKRLWRAAVENLTQNQLNSLIAKGEFTSGTDLNDNQAKSFIRRKDTNSAATW